MLLGKAAEPRGRVHRHRRAFREWAPNSNLENPPSRSTPLSRVSTVSTIKVTFRSLFFRARLWSFRNSQIQRISGRLESLQSANSTQSANLTGREAERSRATHHSRTTRPSSRAASCPDSVLSNERTSPPTFSSAVFLEGETHIYAIPYKLSKSNTLYEPSQFARIQEALALRPKRTGGSTKRGVHILV